jgi:putative CocE/NonD family hydrolase
MLGGMNRPRPRPVRTTLSLLAAALLATASSCTPGRKPAPAVPPTNPTSHYLTMRDGTAIAVDVWLPAGASGRLPTVLRLTRYWRGTAYLDPTLRTGDRDEALAQALNQAGFAVVAVDARGTGASFGVSRGPWAPEEIADYGEVLDWVVAQSWSSGQAVAFGISYDANAAMMLSSLGHPALLAVAPLFPDFDPYASIAYPGGVLNMGFVGAWNAVNHALDGNDACALAGFTGVDCATRRATVSGPRPVDPARLPAALAEHAANVDLVSALLQAPCRDDATGPGLPTLDQVSPQGAAAAIDRAGVPWFVRVGWLDANTVSGALSAYQTLTNPQVLVIGATGHAGLVSADPFLSPQAPPSPPFADQLVETMTFLAETLAGKQVERTIRYQTMGSGLWHVTSVWPPAGTGSRTLHLAAGGLLSPEAPTTRGSDLGLIDPAATTGTRNRWLTPLDAGPVVYGDRAAADARLATWTSDPLPAALEVTGDPSLVLFLSASADARVFAYLEDVALDGTVTYLTEGLLALEHRRPGPAPYLGPAPSHSFRRADLSPFVPGEVMELAIPLAPTSVQLRAGHRLRVAIAGADADTFGGPASAAVSFTIHRGPGQASRLVLPVAP